MNTSGEAADQVVRMMLEGSEVLIKLSGSGAKNAAVLLYSILREQKKTNGAARLSSMLRSGKPLKPSSLLAEVVQSMCTFAKIYDGEYCPHKLGDILSYTDPYDIVRAYKEPGKEGGLKNALGLILHYYNSSSSERPLPVKF